MLRGSVDALRQHCPTKGLTPMGLLVGESARWVVNFRSKVLPSNRPMITKQLPTQSDKDHAPQHKPLSLVFWQGRHWSEATTLPRCAAKMQPLRVGLSKSSAYQLIIKRLLCVLAGSPEMLTFAYARARSALGSIILQLNLYQQWLNLLSERRKIRSREIK